MQFVFKKHNNGPKITPRIFDHFVHEKNQTILNFHLLVNCMKSRLSLITNILEVSFFFFFTNFKTEIINAPLYF